MQGTIVVLMALTGLGCHHKGGHGHGAAACYAEAACYSAAWGGCYASGQAVGYVDYQPAGYATAYSGCYGQVFAGCYGATWDAGYTPAACYGDWGGCYGGGKHHSHRGLFGCFKRKKCGVCNGGYNACYSSWNMGCYSQPVFGSYTPTYGGDVIYSGPVASGQWGTSQGGTTAPTYSIDTAPAPGTAPVVPPATTTPPDPSIPPTTDAPRVDPTPATPGGDVPRPPDAGAPVTTPPGDAGVPTAPAPGGAVPGAGSAPGTGTEAPRPNF